MGISGRERKRRVRGAALAEELAERATGRRAVERLFGAAVAESGGCGEEALFREDRKGLSETELREQELQAKVGSLKALRGARSRAKPHETARRSEAALLPNPNIKKLKAPALPRARLVKQSVRPAKVVGSGAARIERALVDLWDGEEASASVAESKSDGAPKQAVEKKYGICNGLSINPHRNAHQDVVAEAVADEVFKIEQDAIHQHRMRHNASEANDTLIATKTSLDLQLGRDSDSDASDDSALRHAPSKAPAERKSQSERNKQKRKTEERRLAALQTVEKQKLHDIEHAGAIAKKLRVTEKRRSEFQLAKSLKTAKLKRRVGGRTIPRQRVPLLLTSDLPSSMRRVPVASNGLLRERYIGLQETGRIEPQKPHRVNPSAHGR
uniref:Ribosome biogenesis protein NOP53 n=1 Tax=Erythrolobus australicus TaxID=1077150 RepID=A0A7S1TML1_9RHOD